MNPAMAFGSKCNTASANNTPSTTAIKFDTMRFKRLSLSHNDNKARLIKKPAPTV